jgi:hypothetical protein
MPVPIRAAVLAVLVACGLALGACGGDDSYGDKVPRSTPELTPQAGADALVPDQASTTGTDTTSTDDSTTTTTPSGAGAGAAAGAGGGGASAGAQATPAQPQQPSGATGGATTPTQPQQSTGGAGTGGTSPGEFNQFCRDNPGACPGN